MFRQFLAGFFTLGAAMGAARAADTMAFVEGPGANCTAAQMIVEDYQSSAVAGISGTFSFVDGDNMICFRGPQPRRIVIKPVLEKMQAAPATPMTRAPLPRPNLVTRQPMPQPPSPWVPGSNVAGDGGAADKILRGSFAFKTGHVIPLTQASDIGTRIGGNVSPDRVTFNSIELRLAQRF